MANPSFVGAGTFTSGTGAISVPWPTGYADGDLAILVVNSANQAIATLESSPPSGWIVFNAATNYMTAGVAGAVDIALLSMLVSGTQSAVSVADMGSYTAGQIFVFRDVDPIDAATGNFYGKDSFSDTAVSQVFWYEFDLGTDSVYFPPPEALICLFAGLDKDLADTDILSTWDSGTLTGITERADNTTASGVGGGIAMATANLINPTNIDAAATFDTSGRYAAVSAVIFPKGYLSNHPPFGWGGGDATFAESTLSGELTNYDPPFAAVSVAEASCTAALEDETNALAASIAAISTVSATLISQPTQAISSVYPSTVYLGTTTEDVHEGYGAADTIGTTSILAGVPYEYSEAYDPPYTQENVDMSNHALLWVEGGTPIVLSLESSGVYGNSAWGNVRAANGFLFVLMSYDPVAGEQVGSSIITGYRANNPDTTVLHEGNIVRTTLPFATCSDIAYGNNIYVAMRAAWGTPTNQYATSTDLITWTTRTFPMSDMTQCCFIAGRFVAPGYTSTDGINWTSNATSITSPLKVVNGVMFEVTGKWTTDGLNWYGGGGFTGGHNVTYAETLGDGAFVRSQIGNTSISYMQVSSDGATWTDFLAVSGYSGAIFSAGYGVVGLAYRLGWVGDTFYKIGLVVGTNVPTASGRTEAALGAFTYLAGSAVCEATMVNKSELRGAITSELGVDLLNVWQTVVSGSYMANSYIANGKLILKYLSTYYTTPSVRVRATSIGSIAHTLIKTPPQSLYFLAYNGTQIYYSSDAVTWTLAYTHSTTINSVFYVNGEYVAVSSTTSAAAKSTDGVSWTAVTIFYAGCVGLFYTNSMYYLSYQAGSYYKLVYSGGLGSTWSSDLFSSFVNNYVDVFKLGTKLYVKFVYHGAYTLEDGETSFVFESADDPSGLVAAPYYKSVHGGFIGGCADGYLYRSYDTLSWTRIGVSGISTSSTDPTTLGVDPSGREFSSISIGGYFKLAELRYSKGATVLGQLTTAVAALVGIAGTDGSVSADLFTKPSLRAAAAGRSLYVASLTTNAAWNTYSYSSAAASAYLRQAAIPLAGVSEGFSAASANLTAGKKAWLDTFTFAYSSCTADLFTDPADRFVAWVLGLATTTADLTAQHQHALQGAVSCTSASEAALTTYVRFAAAVSAVQSTSASLVATPGFAGSSSDTAVVLGTLTTGLRFAAASNSLATVSGRLYVLDVGLASSSRPSFPAERTLPRDLQLSVRI